MPKPKWNLNAIYISERLQESLRPISRCALTTVVAPMGYGKTTAVEWYLAERARTEAARVIRVSVYSGNLAIFWRNAQDAFARAGFGFLRECACPADEAGGGLLVEELCHALAGERPCYLFLDDFHLLTDRRVPGFLCMLAGRLPSNVHLIVASRDFFLPAAGLMRLGGKLYQIGAEQLRLNHTELAVYTSRCGAGLSDEQIETLLYYSEGWFSAVYLNLRMLFEQGALPDRGSDISAIFTAAMIDPLPERQREFLAVMGLADEFTVEMARFVTEDADAAELLAALTGQNAFVKCLPDGVTYRFHHMMKECALRSFLRLPPERQAAYRERFGAWYEGHGQYLHAMAAYRQSGDYDALLRTVQEDAGILLSALDPAEVLAALNECPVSILKKRPPALLVLMRSMFNWRNIPKMLELKALLLTAISEHPELSAGERGNLLGECDLIMSFLCYNDISAMSRLHRSASAQMSRPAVSIQSGGGWTFGSPSVLMMFYRGAGELESELAEMDECMPHYYKITGNHGQGAETIMRAEAAFVQGRFTDAYIALEQAYAQIQNNGQENMALCCDFLAWRLSCFLDIRRRCTLNERRSELLRHHNAAWLNIWNAASAYYYAVRGEPDRIPAIFAQHRLSAVNTLAPGKPMIEMIENQVSLAQGDYARVIGRSEGLLALCEGMHYALVAMHIRIQTAAAYEMLGKHPEARAMLEQALADAGPDGIALPFAENYPYLRHLLAERLQTGLTAQIIEFGEMAERRRAGETCPAALAALTEREYEIVKLIARRMSNREIAEKLYLSEGSVRQYINQIYGKLQLEGEPRTKRKRLLTLLPGAH